MWTEEMERDAANGKPMPDGLGAPERTLYIALRSLYYQFRQNLIDKDQAKREKYALMNDYKVAVLDEKCREKSRELWKRLPYDIMKCECDECRRVASIILGLK